MYKIVRERFFRRYSYNPKQRKKCTANRTDFPISSIISHPAYFYSLVRRQDARGRPYINAPHCYRFSTPSRTTKYYDLLIVKLPPVYSLWYKAGIKPKRLLRSVLSHSGFRFSPRSEDLIS